MSCWCGVRFEMVYAPLASVVAHGMDVTFAPVASTMQTETPAIPASLPIVPGTPATTVPEYETSPPPSPASLAVPPPVPPPDFPPLEAPPPAVPPLDAPPELEPPPVPASGVPVGLAASLLEQPAKTTSESPQMRGRVSIRKNLRWLQCAHPYHFFCDQDHGHFVGPRGAFLERLAV